MKAKRLLRGFSRHVWTTAIAAVVLLLASRVVMMLHNPSWLVVGNEMCFYLVFPGVYADRLLLEPESDLPFWLVSPTQMKLMWHGGASWIAHCVLHLSRLLDTRSLVLLKILGTTHTCVFVGFFSWTLATVFRHPGDRLQVWFPLLLCAFPPMLFFWVTLTPAGNFMDSHLFYGLFLPFTVLTCQRRMNWWLVLFTGVVAGMAIAYTFSNAIFLAHALVVYFALTQDSWGTRFARVGGLLAMSCAAFGLFGRPSAVWERLIQSHTFFASVPPEGLQGGVEVTNQSYSFVDLLWDHAWVLFGGPSLLSEKMSNVITWLITGIALCGALILVQRTLGLLRSSNRRACSLRYAFLGSQGMLLILFLVAYLAFDPYTGIRSNPTFIWYLVPVYPPLFVGVGALLTVVAQSTLRWSPALVFPPVALGGLLMILQWVGYYRDNAAPTGQPDFGACDARYLDGYFWDEPIEGETSPGAIPLGGGVAILNRQDGEHRCRVSLPDNGDACAVAGFGLADELTAYSMSCGLEPPEQVPVCARAIGAARYGCRHEGLPDPESICTEFHEPLRAACVSGAFQAISPLAASCPSIQYFLRLCEKTMPQEPCLSACREQVAGLLQGMPALDAPPDAVLGECTSWPAPWRGLCAGSLAACESGRRVTGEPSCEEVYRASYDSELPEWHYLAFSQCLSETGHLYPYCSIGVARRAGKVTCGWQGHWR